MIETKSFFVKSGEELDIIDITEKVQEIVERSWIGEGIANVFAVGSTAGISTMEFEPNLKKDLGKMFERIAPSDLEYEHHNTWGDRNGKSHVRAALLGPGIAVPFKDGRLALGQWQQIVLMDFDVPAREREIIVTVIG